METINHTHKVAWVRRDRKCKVETQYDPALEFTGNEGLIYNAATTELDNFLDDVIRPDTWIWVYRLELLVQSGEGVHGGRKELLYAVVKRLLDTGVKLTEGETGMTCNGTSSVIEMYHQSLNRMRNYKGNNAAKGRPKKHKYTKEQMLDVVAVWDATAGKNVDKLKMVKRTYPDMTLSQYYRIKEILKEQGIE